MHCHRELSISNLEFGWAMPLIQQQVLFALHIHWIAWDRFRRSKSDGGLGFGDLRIFNQALLGRQAWRLLERPESFVLEC